MIYITTWMNYENITVSAIMHSTEEHYSLSIECPEQANPQSEKVDECLPGDGGGENRCDC